MSFTYRCCYGEILFDRDSLPAADRGYKLMQLSERELSGFSKIFCTLWLTKISSYPLTDNPRSITDIPFVDCWFRTFWLFFFWPLTHYSLKFQLSDFWHSDTLNSDFTPALQVFKKLSVYCELQAVNQVMKMFRTWGSKGTCNKNKLFAIISTVYSPTYKNHYITSFIAKTIVSFCTNLPTF